MGGFSQNRGISIQSCSRKLQSFVNRASNSNSLFGIGIVIGIVIVAVAAVVAIIIVAIVTVIAIVIALFGAR